MTGRKDGQYRGCGDDFKCNCIRCVLPGTGIRHRLDCGLSMTSTIITDPVKDDGKFPKLKQWKTEGGYIWIVLITEEDGGFMVYSDDPNEPVGTHSDHWGSEGFALFHGTIQLRNE